MRGLWYGREYIQMHMETKVIIQFPMTKNQTAMKQPKMFSLVPLQPRCHHPSVAVVFTTQTVDGESPRCALPRFNPDRRYFTASFVLPAQSALLAKNVDFEAFRFEERIRATAEKSIQQQEPCPQEPFCQICKQIYDNYHTHIRTHKHLKLTADSPANALIEQLVSKITRKRKPITKALAKVHCPAQPIAKRLTRRAQLRIKASISTGVQST